MNELTKNQIIAELRKLGWRRRDWRWTKHSKKLPKRFIGVDLRTAASLEALTACESLTEPRK